MSTFKKSILSKLHAFATAQHKADETARTAFRSLVAAAIVAKTEDVFSQHVTEFYREIRENVDGFAESIGAEKGENGFTVPGSIMAQVSQVKRALKLGVDLGTEKAPKGPGEVRKATSEAAKKAQPTDAADAADAGTLSLTPAQQEDLRIRTAALDALRDAEKAIKNAEGNTLRAMVEAVTEFAGNMLAILGEPSEADSADDVADAA
jgi:hypothetical protein